MNGAEVPIEANTAAIFGAACSAATKKETEVQLNAVLTVDLNWLPLLDDFRNWSANDECRQEALRMRQAVGS